LLAHKQGFSDSKSTTARRMRNKPIVLSTLASLSHATASTSGADSGGGGGSAKSKVPSLRWNEERLELEVVRREREATEALSRSRDLLAAGDRESREAVMAPHSLLGRQTSGHSLEVGSVDLMMEVRARRFFRIIFVVIY